MNIHASLRAPAVRRAPQPLARVLAGVFMAGAFGLGAAPASAITVYDITLIGFYDAGHTRSDGWQNNSARFVNDAGQVAGHAERYNGSTSAGYSAWLHSGGTTQEIGLTGAGYTRSDGYRYNDAHFVNDVGQVAGLAQRYNGLTVKGQSAWLYSGGSAQEIGLTGAGHTRSDGWQNNSARFLNAAGQVAGHADRYSGSAATGLSAWLYSGGSTQEIGLTGAGHTRSDGYQVNYAQFLNAAGQVAGYADRYNGSTATGRSAWFFDPLTSQTYSMDGSISVLTGTAYSSIYFLGDDGLALGQYTLYDVGGSNLGSRAFSFTVAEGWNDLGSLVDGGLNDAGWSYLANAYRANAAGQIIGNGVLAGMNGQAAYLLTPVPEPETWAMLVAGLALVGTAARRRSAPLAAN